MLSFSTLFCCFIQRTDLYTGINGFYVWHLPQYNTISYQISNRISIYIKRNLYGSNYTYLNCCELPCRFLCVFTRIQSTRTISTKNTKLIWNRKIGFVKTECSKCGDTSFLTSKKSLITHETNYHNPIITHLYWFGLFSLITEYGLRRSAGWGWRR